MSRSQIASLLAVLFSIAMWFAGLEFAAYGVLMGWIIGKDIL